MKEDPKCILTIDIKNNKFFQNTQFSSINSGSVFTETETNKCYVALSSKNILVVIDMQT